MITQEKITEILKTVLDPELKRDIVSLGMVREIRIESSRTIVVLSVSNPSPAVRQSLQDAVGKALSPLPGAGEIRVEFVAVPQKPGFAMKNPLPGIKHVIAVASGKGGVGKTTVAVNLSLALAGQGHKVGLMDGDIYGPNVPLMLGVPADARPSVGPDEKIIPMEAQGIRMISMGVLVPADQPMVWRGPMLHSAVTQFLQKVDWGELDFLLVDLPPGTGDVQLSLVQTVPLSGAVIVTTPQEVALMDVRKGIAMFRKTEVPILGIIENMTGEIFGRGGGRKAAEALGVPFLGEIPLDVSIRLGGDSGEPIVAGQADSPAAKEFNRAAAAVTAALVHLHEV